jgi:hypothetical protein
VLKGLYAIRCASISSVPAGGRADPSARKCCAGTRTNSRE